MANAQDPIPVPPEVFPHLGIERLENQLEKLGAASLISEKRLAKLKKPLGQSVQDLQTARPKQAIQHLEVFKNKMQAQVSPDIGDPLVREATNVQRQIGSIVNRTAIAVASQCSAPLPTGFQVLEVGPNESLPTISSALAFAAEQGWAAVELSLAPVAYREGTIYIDRHTRFVSHDGPANIIGGLRNIGPFLLEVRDTIITGSAGIGVFVDNACATTILNGVEVQFSDGTGIRQRGGSLSADGLTVLFSNTSAGTAGADRHSGRGVHVSDGANVCLKGAVIDRNGAGALLAEGIYTQVFVTAMSAQNNTVSPAVIDEAMTGGDASSGYASVEIRDSALFLGELIGVTSAELLGLAVDDNARAHVRYSLVERSIPLRVGPFRSVGGINIAANSGELELNAITSRRSGVGLSANNVGGGFLKTDGVHVTHNDLGVAVQTTSPEGAACAVQCLSSVRYARNDSRLRFYPFQPIPGDGGPLPGCTCPSVEFSPNWCSARPTD